MGRGAEAFWFNGRRDKSWVWARPLHYLPSRQVSVNEDDVVDDADDDDDEHDDDDDDDDEADADDDDKDWGW